MQGLFCLSGKTIVLTAGTSYLGRAVACGLAEFGASLIITSRDKKRSEALALSLSQEYSVSAEGKYMDINDEKGIEELFCEVNEKYGGIDVVINNASFSKPGKVETMSSDDFRAGIDGTVNSVFKVTHHALKHMLTQRHGNFINISSMYGVVSPNPSNYGETGFDNPPNYGAGKAAIIQFTKYIACNYGAKGIRANCISPGPFPHPKVQENKWFTDRLAESTALKRIGQPPDLKGLAVLLASDASAYITGQNILVDGGWTAW